MPGSPETPASGSSLQRTLYLLTLAGLFLIGTFVYAVLRFAPNVPHPAEMYKVKRQLLESNVSRYNSAAFGSSHILQGFAPVVFDREFARQTRTLNLASPTLTSEFARKLSLEFAARVDPPKGQPCFLLLERNFRADPLTPRSKGPARPVPFYKRAIRVLLLLRTALFGAKPSRPLTPDQVTDEQRGQELVFELPPGTQAQKDHLVSLISNAPRLSPLGPEQQMTPESLKLLDELQQAAPSKHLSLVYVVYPSLNDLAEMPNFPDHVMAGNTVVPVINLARPDKFPSLYQIQNWFLENHLNATGADVASAILAHELTNWYRLHGAPQSCN